MASDPGPGLPVSPSPRPADPSVRSRPRRRIPGCRILTGRWSTPPGPHRCAREPNLESSIAGGGRARTSAPGLRAASSPGPAPRAAADAEGGLPGPRGAPTRRAVGRAGLRARARPPARHSARQSLATARTRRRPSLPHTRRPPRPGFWAAAAHILRGAGCSPAPPPPPGRREPSGVGGADQGRRTGPGLAGGSGGREAHGAAGRGARARHSSARTRAPTPSSRVGGPREPVGSPFARRGLIALATPAGAAGANGSLPCEGQGAPAVTATSGGAARVPPQGRAGKVTGESRPGAGVPQGMYGWAARSRRSRESASGAQGCARAPGQSAPLRSSPAAAPPWTRNPRLG